MGLVVRTAVFGTRHGLARFVNIVGQLLLFGFFAFGRFVCVSRDKVGAIIVGSPEGFSHLLTERHSRLVQGRRGTLFFNGEASAGYEDPILGLSPSEMRRCTNPALE